jgi:hypothetical protein
MTESDNIEENKNIELIPNEEEEKIVIETSVKKTSSKKKKDVNTSKSENLEKYLSEVD